MPSTGKKSVACWAHDGSYLADLGVMTDGGDQLYIESGRAAQGFATVTLNGQSLTTRIGQQLPLTFSNTNTNITVTGHITLHNTHELTLVANAWRIELENSDEFVNLRSVAVTTPLNALTAHGLLGQTWRAAKWSGAVKEIEGDVDDYVVMEDNVWGKDFVFNRFQVQVEEDAEEQQ